MLSQSDISPATIASKFINHTTKNIFLTGKAGTGKTTFLKHIIEHTHKKALIVAPTGIAAINAGGVTIHSLFQLPFGNFVPVSQNLSNQLQFKINDPASLIRNMQMSSMKRNLLREVELLIVDEVSMLRADLLDAMDVILKHVRNQRQRAFGGVQVLFIGDLLQLPPVVKDEEWGILKQHYKSIFFFDARVLQQEKPLYIELDKIYRQSDNEFIQLLNNLRQNQVTENDINLLNKYYQPGFKPALNQNYITLTTHNYKAINLNKEFLNNIQEPSFFFDAKVEGEFSEYSYPVEKTLELKKGAQIMFVKNDPTGAQRFFNGKIGVVSKLTNNSIEVTFNDTGKSINVDAYEWQNLKYVLNETTNEIEEEITGTFKQFPIKLAWAITVHKSQGLTFDKAIVDIGSAFAPGQVYVALSRLRSLNGLVLTSRINYNELSQDKDVMDFAKTKNQQAPLTELIDAETLVFLKQYLSQSFDFGPLSYQVKTHCESYTKDEKKSAKQKHHKWALAFKDEFENTKVHADKFVQQVMRIIEYKEPDYLNLLEKRVLAAKDYFTPYFKKSSATLLAQVELILNDKKTKVYLNELLELELAFYEQLKKMNKAFALCQAIVNKKEFTKSDVHSNDEARAERIKNIFLQGPKKAAEKSETTSAEKKALKKEKKPKEKIPDTKETSYLMYENGKTIEEIAQLRSMTAGTIEGHLAHYVATGKLDVKEFVSEEKIKHIIEASQKMDSTLYGALKQVLGDEYTYSEIKFAMAELNKTKEV